MIVSAHGRIICPICHAARMSNQYAHLTPDTLDAVCKHCRKAERAGKLLPRSLRTFKDMNSAPVIGPTARAKMLARQARHATRPPLVPNAPSPLPPGVTSSRAAAIARWLNEAAGPVKWNQKDVWYALRGAKTVQDIWPACPAHLVTG